MSVIISEKQYKDSFIKDGEMIFTPEVEVIIREDEKGVKYKEYIITKSAEEKRKEYSSSIVNNPQDQEIINATLLKEITELKKEIATLKGAN